MLLLWVSFCRTEKQCKLCPQFFLKITVTKRFDFFKIPQLFWRPFVLYSLQIFSFWSLPIFFYKAIFTDFTPNRWFLAIFEVDIMPSWNEMCTAGPELRCPLSWKLYLNDFRFFGFLSISSRTQVTTVKSLGDDGATNHHCQYRHGHQLQTVATGII